MIMLMHTYLSRKEQQLLEQNMMLLQDEQMKEISVLFKNCAPFIKCISKINDTEIDNVQDIDIVMPANV